jgi:hypothetical protein
MLTGAQEHLLLCDLDRFSTFRKNEGWNTDDTRNMSHRRPSAIGTSEGLIEKCHSVTFVLFDVGATSSDEFCHG